MQVDQPPVAAEPRPGLSLDPFEFHGFPASCIAGLGGDLPQPDPHYAFHTPYVPAERGHAHFVVRFTNLQARRGTLWLRIHMLPNEPGAVARMVTSERIQLNRLVQIGGELSLRFEAFRGATYALMGLIQDDTDARADALSIVLDRPSTGEADAQASDLDEAQATRFGTDALRVTRLIQSIDAPTMKAPVSQPSTEPQLRERTFAGWSKALQLGRDAANAWPEAYMLQALTTYGVLEEGVRALRLSVGNPDRLSPLLATHGISAEAGICVWDERGLTARRTVEDSEQGLPGDLRSYDLLWSIDVASGAPSARDASRMIEVAMECLRPGGLAVHVFPYAPEGSSSHTSVFDARAVERLALTLISRGHDVARLKLARNAPLASRQWPDGTHAPGFGIIARRASLIL